MPKQVKLSPETTPTMQRGEQGAQSAQERAVPVPVSRLTRGGVRTRPSVYGAADILAMQRTMGNRVVQRLLAAQRPFRTVIQQESLNKESHTHIVQRTMDEESISELKKYLLAYDEELESDELDDLFMYFEQEYETFEASLEELDREINKRIRSKHTAKGNFTKTFFDKVPEWRNKTKRELTILDSCWQLQNEKTAEKPITDKFYAFVTLLDGRVMVWPVVGEKDTFHRGLSDFAKEVQFAGEIMFDEKGGIAGWNNKSGNYKPKTKDAKYAGLPMDKFVAHEKTTEHIKAYLEK